MPDSLFALFGPLVLALSDPVAAAPAAELFSVTSLISLLTLASLEIVLGSTTSSSSRFWQDGCRRPTSRARDASASGRRSSPGSSSCSASPG